MVEVGGVDLTTQLTLNLSVGVFNGAFLYKQLSTSKPTFANSVAASTTFGTDYNTGSKRHNMVLLTTILMQEYVVKCDAAVTQAIDF